MFEVDRRPASLEMKKKYEARVEEIKQRQIEEYRNRVLANKKYAEEITQKLIKEHRELQNEEEKKLNTTDSYYVPAESKFLIVVLLRTRINMNKKILTTLNLLRLTHINNAIIIKNNKSTKKMLDVVKDRVAYGTLDYDTLRRLLYVRGEGRDGTTLIPLTNETIEERFEGRYRCIEELVNIIYYGKQDMSEVCRFLGTIKLNSPNGGFPGKKTRAYLQKGNLGNQEELISNLVKRMI